MKRLDGKVCIVTGAASGIGRAAAIMLAGLGGRVVAADLREDPSLTEEIGGEDYCRVIAADVTDEGGREKIFAEALDTWGTVHVLVNNAGIGSLCSITEITTEEWDRVLDVNLKSAFFVAQRAIRIFEEKKSGTIINMASAAAKIGGLAVGAHYTASKAGIVGLTKSMALYCARFGVTVNAVCPGPIETALTDEWGKKLNEEFAAKIPLKHYGRPEDVAELICFLASDSSNYITGASMDVNGGLVMD
jgi:3-oxoacyl-[acyl-carrier protein] reductase